MLVRADLDLRLSYSESGLAICRPHRAGHRFAKRTTTKRTAKRTTARKTRAIGGRRPTTRRWNSRTGTFRFNGFTSARRVWRKAA